MDRKFIRSLHEIRENLKANKISVNEVVKYSDRYQKYADEVLEEEKSGKISKEFMNSLEDYLMICLDVYTYSENGDVLIPDYTYDMVMNVYCDHTHNERLVYADYIMSTMLWPFVKHEAPFMVGTISRKIYDVNTLASYLQQLKRDGYHKLLYAPKFDGISAAVTIRNGLIERAVTRNNGIEGQDITEVIRRMNQVKKIFTKNSKDGYYKCELVVTTEDFSELIKLKVYKNRRSAASAIVSAPSNLIYSEFLTAVPLAWVNFEGTRMKYLAEKFSENLADYPEDFSVETVYDNIERILKHIRSSDYPVRTDGVVIFPIHTYEDEPDTVDLMSNCLAYKVNTQEAATKVLNVFMSIGRTGLAKPMAELIPVEVNEVFMKLASLGSMANFESMNLHEGEEISVYAAGDVIPQIKFPEPRNYPKGAGRIKVDLTCPHCGKKLRPKFTSEANLYCVNPRCPRVLSGRIAGFLEKLDVAEGFRDATFYNLAEKGLVNTIPDLFTLYQRVGEISKALGSRMGAEKLFKGLNQLKTKTFEVSQVLGAIGIEGISTKRCQMIFGSVSLDYLLGMKKNKLCLTLMNVDGVSTTIAEKLADWINENRDFIEFLMENMKIVPDRINYGTLCFTGFRNKEYAEKFKSIGFPVMDNVTNDTVAVVYTGDLTTGNARKALKKEVPLVHLGQIDKLLDELTERDRELKTQNIKYGHYQLIRDIQNHVPCYR